MRRTLVLALCAGCGGGGGTPDAAPPDAPQGPIDATPAVDVFTPFCDPTLPQPDDLACTGLYLDFPSRTVNPDVREFAPGLVLWSDGAHKSRWIRLPPGTKVDVTDANEWVFPIGTKVWKEFRLVIGGVEKRIETRYMVKQADGTWFRTTYEWSPDEASATQLTTGKKNAAGTTYEIPSQAKCLECHSGRKDNLLGFEALGLAAPGATGLTYDELQHEALLTASNGNEMIPASQLQVPGDDVEQTALGFLHMNCGVCCHNANRTNTRFQMRLLVDATGHVGTVQDSDTFKTAINDLSAFTPAGAPATPVWYRLRPLDQARSELLYRIGVRNDGTTIVDQQMPPIDTHLVDDAGVAAIAAWIDSMTVARGYPPPAP